ncbi:hypothetical protein BaRGS_00034250 [Batillaria attramentaria]|uniref:Mannosylglycerate hydrolase MGH1-like glycoside hydrolase domain-containing protein n=1 Tax=Batillaria attramentaria TaxID=370345 RepID=A0ABD0JIH4_9CAEN
MAAERKRLKEDRLRTKNWKRWGPYLSERQWATVREDYSADGDCWRYFPHEQARSRAYRWGEDGLLGITDRQCRVCLALALWNEKDPFLKERLFGLTGHQGNHGEDVKELYYYLDNIPTHSYMKALYKYPQEEYPYQKLVDENAKRSVYDNEYELASLTTMLTGTSWRSMERLLPMIYWQHTLSRIVGRTQRSFIYFPLCGYEMCGPGGMNAYLDPKPHLKQVGPGKVLISHSVLGDMMFEVDVGPEGDKPTMIFTENNTNHKLLYKGANATPYVKDAFHTYVVHGKQNAVNPNREGTKCAAHYVLNVESEQEVTIRVRLYHHLEKPSMPFGKAFDEVMAARHEEADCFYQEIIGYKSMAEQLVARQAYAGLLWSKQFYHYVVQEWLAGDKNQPPPPSERLYGRNTSWLHLFNRDVISMPDKWEYPWYASWDLAFHMIPFANIDLHFAKEQLQLFLREWYMHPNGQIPAYEFAFSDVNPPVHAYAVLKVYKASGPKDHRDVLFLARCFHKLVLNFTWWVNRKDPEGKNIFDGGFLGLDNIGVFDRSKPLPIGGKLAQADATAWMAFFCVIMLEISLILARRDPIYEDMASKFFEHFVFILDAINNVAGEGLWNDIDGFYYDHVRGNNCSMPLKIRSMVGMVPLFSSMVLHESEMRRHPGFYKRTKWFLEHNKNLAQRIMCRESEENGNDEDTLMLTVVTRDQLVRVLHYLLDEKEFLSPYGIRSLSKAHKDNPFKFEVGHQTYCVEYQPSESRSKLFGGNSNWRGPIWFPMNYLLIENLHRLDYFYRDTLKVECPTGSGKYMRLKDVAAELSARLSRIFLPDPFGSRACHGTDERYAKDPNFRDLVLFYEYFDGETGRGCGASHQTGWTALIVNLLKSAHHRKSLSGDSTSSLCASTNY